jgi:hypothetical protein
VNGAAAFAAWAGAAVIVLADGRRGLAVGISLIAAGFAALAWLVGDWFEGAALLAGGLICAIQLLRTGGQDWGLMPAGSTSRLLVAVVGGILALWLAASVTTGPRASLRFAAVAVLVLMAARLLQAQKAVQVLTASAGLAIGLAAASALGRSAPGLAPYLVAGVIAAGALLLPQAESRGA